MNMNIITIMMKVSGYRELITPITNTTITTTTITIHTQHIEQTLKIRNFSFHLFLSI